MAIVFTAYVGLNGPNADSNSNRATLFGLLASGGLDGYTTYRAEGCYKGVTEPSIVVVVIANSHNEAVDYGTALHEVCHRYKELTQQESVWVTRAREDLQVL